MRIDKQAAAHRAFVERHTIVEDGERAAEHRAIVSFSFSIQDSPSQTRMMMQPSRTEPTDSTSPGSVSLDSEQKLRLSQLDLTLETSIKEGNSAGSDLIEDKDTTKSNECTMKIDALELLVGQLRLELDEAAKERKMLVESVTSIDRRLLGASKSRKDTRTDLKRIESKVVADFSKIYTRLEDISSTADDNHAVVKTSETLQSKKVSRSQQRVQPQAELGLDSTVMNLEGKLAAESRRASTYAEHFNNCSSKLRTEKVARESLEAALESAHSNIAATKMNIAATKKEADARVQSLQSALTNANSTAVELRDIRRLLTSTSSICYEGLINK